MNGAPAAWLAAPRPHHRARGEGRASLELDATSPRDAGGRGATVAGGDDEEAAPLMAGGSGGGVGGGGGGGGGRVDWLATGACFAFPALGGLLFGYDIGATSGVLSSLTSPTLSGTDWYQLDALQRGLVVSASLLGALAGSLAALAAGNRLGRRTELLAAALLYGTSAAAMGGVPGLNGLLACRLTYGLGIGFAMHAAPAYIAETAPPSVRGLLISLKEAAIVGGILFGYLTSYMFAEELGGWRSIYASAAPLAVLLGLGMLALPESPRWLLLSGDRPAAAAALQRTLGRAAGGRQVEAELASMGAAGAGSPKSAAGAAGGGGGGAWELVTQPRFRRPLLVGSSLMLFQQITGQPSVLYYAQQIFEAAGFASGQEAAEVSVVLGAFKLVMTLVAVATVDKLGRRPLLLAGVSGMVAALLALAWAQGGGAEAAAGGAAAWVSVGALLLYVGCYQCSFGPISWLIVGEVFPLQVRSQAIALAAALNYASNFAVSLALPTLEGAVGLPATYLAFAAIGAAAVGSIYLTVPETKGRTLEEIEAMWGAK